MIFSLNNKKNAFITFFIFLFIGFFSIYIPDNQFTIKDIIYRNSDAVFFLHIILNKNLFLDIIFFIMIALSYNQYRNYKSISEVFTLWANIFIHSFFISLASYAVFMLLFLMLISLLKNFIMLIFPDTIIVINTFILFTFYMLAFAPFVTYLIYEKMNKNISVYISRLVMYVSLYNIVKHLFSMIMPYNNPYDIRMNFILYNVALAIAAVNLFFVRMDYKSSILTKLIYIVFPIIAFIFNIIILTSTIYRIREYGISPNKLTLLFTNIIMLVHFILIIFDNIKSLRKLESIKNIKNIILTNNRSYYVYVYGIIAFIVCFIMPLFYNVF